MPDETVVAKGGNFVTIFGFLLADLIGSFGMAAGFGKLSTQKHHKKLKTPPKINKKKIDFINFIFSSNLTRWTLNSDRASHVFYRK